MCICDVNVGYRDVNVGKLDVTFGFAFYLYKTNVYTMVTDM